MNNEAAPHQPKLHYEDLDDALQDLVLALGGNKRVAHRLWPSMAQDDAAQRLRHCLNKSRREKLDPQELLRLLAWGREINFHGAKHFVDHDTGYNPSAPRDPKEEEQRAVEALEQAAAALQRATDTLIRAREGAAVIRLAAKS